MDSAEASGKTVEDARNRALAMIGATRDDLDRGAVELTVLDEGTRGGLFKRGRDAQVRVNRVGGAPASSRPAEREDPDTRIPHAPQGGGRGQRGSREGRSASSGGRREGGRGEGGRGGSSQGGGRDRDRAGGRTPRRTGLETPPSKLTMEDFLKRPAASAGDNADTPAPAASSPGRPAAAPRGSRGGRGRDGGESRGGNGQRSGGERPPRAERPPGDRPDRERRRREDEPHIDPDINAEEVDFAAHVVDDLLRLLDIDAELTIREPLTPGDGLGVVLAVIDIVGDDLGLLIGRRGETLLSFQYLVNLIVTRRYPDRGGVTVDVEHYRHRREEQVVTLARRMADRVRESGVAITLEPMSAAERRLVHIALADDPELVTNSMGEGEHRKVVISTRQ